MTSVGHQGSTNTGVSASSASAAPVVNSLSTSVLERVSNIVPRVERALRRLDYRVPLGGAVVVFAMIFALVANVPQHRAILELQQQAIAQHSTVSTATSVVSQPSTAFLGSLPTRADIPKVLSQIYQQASDTGVEIVRGNYELTLMHSGTLARYQFTFPLKSTYPRIRAFIDKTLLAVPAAAIESLRLERKNIGDESVNAELRFTVFVQSPS